MIVEDLEPGRNPADLTIGVAVATFNQAITDRLLDGAIKALEASGVGRVLILRVAGAWELPVAAAHLARQADAVVAIGAVIKGETDHYEIIVNESASGLTRVALDAVKPVTNAVLAAHTLEQALDRSEPGPGNKGAEAAAAAVAAALMIPTNS
ncbi:MAG TPA: 6,7-dimethyl-8-ribityllumazine synthase [Acidimicrobiia bacterium]|nr:6,7-dimethyl-8-ribityllumazine synthase [Acidimicrobiia bacterium]